MEVMGSLSRLRFVNAWRDYTELEAEYPLPMDLQVVEPPRRYVISSVRSMEIQSPVASSYTLFQAW